MKKSQEKNVKFTTFCVTYDIVYIIRDISALYGMTNLIQLTLNGNQITDISVLGELPNLSDLDLRDNPISDWSPVEHIINVIGRPF